WAEFYEVRFEVPRAGNGDTFGWYLEGKYKLTPQLFAALRFNQQVFDTVDFAQRSPSLGQDLIRLDGAVTYRFTTCIQLKMQYSFQHQTDVPHKDNHLVAAQFTVRF